MKSIPASRPFTVFTIGMAYFLFFIHLGSSPLGAGMSGSVASGALTAGALAILVVGSIERFARFTTMIARLVGASLMLSGTASLLMSSASPGPDLGIVGFGLCVFLLDAGHEHPTASTT